MQKGPAVASTITGEGNTTAWKLCGLDKNTCLTVFYDVSSSEKSDPSGNINPQLYIQFLTRCLENFSSTFFIVKIPFGEQLM